MSFTIRDVAAKAGCSIASVSRVTTGAGPVSSAMRERVLAAAAELDFDLSPSRPNIRPVIGVLIPSVTNPVFATALAGIEQRARSQGLQTILAQSNYDVAQEVEVVRALMAERPIGMIMTVCDPKTSAALALVMREKLPVVTIYNEAILKDVGAVSVDNHQMVFDMTMSLIASGHRSIVFVSGRFAASDRAARRYEGYRDAMIEAHLPARPAIEVGFIDAAQDIDLTHVVHEYRPTAILASNDLLAVTVIACLRHMGLSVPRDISVVGFDGIDIARLLSPKLTTIAQPSHTMGILAASMMLDIAAGRRQPEHLIIEATAYPGETVAPARQDPDHLSPTSQNGNPKP